MFIALRTKTIAAPSGAECCGSTWRFFGAPGLIGFRCYKYKAALRPGHFSPNNIIPHPSSLRLIPTKGDLL